MKIAVILIALLVASVLNGNSALAGTAASAESPGKTAGTANGVSTDRNTRFSAAQKYSAQRSGQSILIIKDGKTIVEDYPNGGEKDKAQLLASGTKSFTGIIAAAAVQDGFLKLDEKVSDTISEWKSDSIKSQITVRQILSLTSGLDPGENSSPPPYNEAILQKALHKPGEHWEYGPAPFQIFGELIKRKLKARGEESDPLSYLERRIFKPLGISYAYWRRIEGNPNMPSGSAFTARNWAKFGDFILHDGVDEGKALVDPDAFAQLFKGSTANPGYGISWWLPGKSNLISTRNPKPVTSADIPEDIRMAAGAGFQRLYVIPSKALIVVRQTAGKSRRRDRQEAVPGVSKASSRWSDAEFLRLILSDLN